MYAVQFLVRIEQIAQPRASQKQLAQLTKPKPYPKGICLSFDAFTYSWSFLSFGDLLKSPKTLWHLQFKNSKIAQRPTSTTVVHLQCQCPEGKKKSSIELNKAKRTQQWMLFIRTLLKGIDYLLNTCTKAVSYSLFKQCRIPNTRPTVWVSVYDSFLPSKQKRGRMMMGPKYSIQKTISHRICLPKFLTVKMLVGGLAILSGIQLSVRTCLVQPSLQESSCWSTGIFVCLQISSFIPFMVIFSSATTVNCLSLQLMVRFNAISYQSTKQYQFLYLVMYTGKTAWLLISVNVKTTLRTIRCFQAEPFLSQKILELFPNLNYQQ